MHTLLVITGPTGVGKTELTLRLAEHFGCPIVSADSRQIYREIPIGTATPTDEEQTRVKHYFVGTKSVTEDYNAGQYERDCLDLLAQLQRNATSEPFAILTGGSMLYIDAVCKGFDDIPTITQQCREEVREDYQKGGLTWLQQQVQKLDPDYWSEVDQSNPQRLMHCIEVSLSAGKPYSSFRKKTQATRDFNILKVAVERPREELYERINTRVEQMITAGLEGEAHKVYPLRQLHSLQTVGFREFFDYFDGRTTREEAIRLIKQNTRHYAKRQLTWFRADKTIHWLNANDAYETQLDNITHWLHTDCMQ